MSENTHHLPENVAELLDLACDITDEIRRCQDDIARLGEERRSVIRKLRDNVVTYREIANAMGMTEQNVYKIVKGGVSRGT